MEDLIRLSIIIPHLNDAPQLRGCLASLYSQRSPRFPFEVIVVDNGSTDRPDAVCRQFPGVRLEVEKMPGPGPARNRGAGIARGDLLAFIDADCEASPRWVESIIEFMDRNPAVDFVGGDIRIRPEREDRLTATEAYEAIFSYRARLYVEQLGFAATGNMAVRAKVFAAVGPFGGISTMEDTEWGQRATARGYRAAYLADARVSTPSCASYAELARRWDRHVAHEFREVSGQIDTLKWLVKSLVIAASPPAEIPRIIRSDRIAGIRDRALAVACLARIRFYRARRMVGLVMRDNTAATVGSWNRE